MMISGGNVGICWNMLEYVGICWNMLEYVGICWNMLECVGICWNMLEYVGICWNMLDPSGFGGKKGSYPPKCSNFAGEGFFHLTKWV